MTACVDWEFDWGCVEGWAGASATDRDVASETAANLMQSWTLGQFSACPITIRPMGGCRHYPGFIYSAEAFWDANLRATWLICGCWNRGLRLPGKPREVVSVYVNGVLVSPSAYRLDLRATGVYLVRTDGSGWPAWQDMTVGGELAGGFEVTYLDGAAIPAAGKRAGAKLAMELLKLSTTGKCQLPDRVVSLVRAGVSMQLGTRQEAKTGVREIDQFLNAVNPQGLSAQPVAWSPDGPAFSQTIWPAS